MFRLDDKAALITGATGGIGNEIAKTLHKSGATVLISGTNHEKLNQLAEELNERVHILQSDLRDVNATKQLFDRAHELVPAIDILVFNAGVTKDNLMILMSEEEFDEVINIKLK